MKDKSEQIIEINDTKNLPKDYPKDLVNKEDKVESENTMANKLEYYHDQWSGYREVM